MRPQGAASETEARFNGLRRRLGLLGAPLLFAILWVWPMPSLSIEAHRLCAVGALTVTLWVTEAIPLAAAALLGPALAALLGACSATQAFAPFAHPVIFLFMGGFLLAAGLGKAGVDRRAALWLISRAWIRGSPRRALIAITVVGFVFSMWISNTAAMAMLLPVALGIHGTIASALGRPASELRSFGGGLVLSLAYGTSLGGMATPIGTAPNVIALSLLEKQTNIHIDFLGWMTFALPTALVMLVIMLAVVARRFPAPVAEVHGLRSQVLEELRTLGAWQPAERRVLAIFGLAVGGWLLPSLLRIALGSGHPASTWARGALDEGVVAILCASLLFVLPGRPPAEGAPRPCMLDGGDVQRLDWGTLLLLGGGISLGNLAFDTGLAEAMGRGFLTLVGPLAMTSWGLVVLSTMLVLALTEFTSNTATTSMMLPVIIGIAQASGHDPHAAVLSTTLAASCAFMLPVSTPPNAIAYGSRMIRLPEMVRTGIWLDGLGYLVLMGAAFGLLPAVFSG